jgi:hypothetical protein
MDGQDAQDFVDIRQEAKTGDCLVPHDSRYTQAWPHNQGLALWEFRGLTSRNA